MFLYLYSRFKENENQTKIPNILNNNELRFVVHILSWHHVNLKKNPIFSLLFAKTAKTNFKFTQT